MATISNKSLINIHDIASKLVGFSKTLKPNELRNFGLAIHNEIAELISEDNQDAKPCYRHCSDSDRNTFILTDNALVEIRPNGKTLSVPYRDYKLLCRLIQSCRGKRFRMRQLNNVSNGTYINVVGRCLLRYKLILKHRTTRQVVGDNSTFVKRAMELVKCPN